jgi:hypothetical protein
MAFTEDFAPFMQQAEFADSALLAGAPVQVIFDREFLAVNTGLSDVASSSPVARLASSLVPSNVVGVSLVISTGQGAGNWRVSGHEPDGTGLSLLTLEKA